MSKIRQGAVLCLVLAAPALWAQPRPASDAEAGQSQVVEAQAAQLYSLANQARAAKGLRRLQWDPALALGALRHCRRMAQEGPIAHRYGGEPDVTARASQAGAHFSLVEENIAVGASPASIHSGWMNSPDHLANLMNPGVDRVGIAVVAHGGVLYAVTDFARAVPVLTQAQVEAAYAGLLRARGLTVLKDPSAARAYCASSGRFSGPDAPGYLIRFQNADLTQLPAPLAARVATGQYRQAAVGSCAPQNLEGAFTVFRVAVLLY